MLEVPPLFAALRPARNVLIAGAGGGFDVYAGLPLALALDRLGKQVTLANLTFSELAYVQDDRWLGPGIARIDAETDGSLQYFPERTLARWLQSQAIGWEIFAIEIAGVQPVAGAYRTLHEHVGFDAVVLVDGGTDILLCGDEFGLGTPHEDMTSLLAATQLQVPIKIVSSIGFGIDAFHGVAHTDVLENLAALSREGAYLGALSIPPDSDEAILYVDAVRHAATHTPTRPSIVNGEIAAALQGRYGQLHIGTRTTEGEVYVNPLMTIYFSVQADALAGRLRYADDLRATTTARQVALVIESYRALRTRRPYRAFPH